MKPFSELFKSGPHSFEDIRESLHQATLFNKEFFSLLIEHHDYIKESIRVLMDDYSTDLEKQGQLVRFFRLVEMHAKAEEETLYVHLKQNPYKEARIEGYGGKDEHDVVFQMEDELLRMGYLTEWNEEIAAKARVVAALFKNHISEEEDRMFKIAKRNFASSEMELQRNQYIARCHVYIDDFKTRSNGAWLNRSSSDLSDLPNFAP